MVITMSLVVNDSSSFAVLASPSFFCTVTVTTVSTIVLSPDSGVNEMKSAEVEASQAEIGMNLSSISPPAAGMENSVCPMTISEPGSPARRSQDESRTVKANSKIVDILDFISSLFRPVSVISIQM